VWVYEVGGPAIYPWRLVSRLERRFEVVDARPVRLRWFAGGTLVTADPDAGAPLLLLGADAYGRDIFSRLLHGARTTLLLSALAAVFSTMLGACVGAAAGYFGGWFDGILSRLSEFILILPAIYVAMALRAVLPLVLSAPVVFVLLLGVFTLLGWPIVARGVRAVIVVERNLDYAMAARASGASDLRVLLRHVLPASSGYLRVQGALLLPAFMIAESTLSYVGLGFPASIPTWGTMLQEAANVALLGEAPWTLAPAAAIFMVVLGVNLVAQGPGGRPVQLKP
jgi:peptide/nickel transport system permease protein